MSSRRLEERGKYSKERPAGMTKGYGSNKEDTVVPPGDCKASNFTLNFAPAEVKTYFLQDESLQLRGASKEECFTGNSGSRVLRRVHGRRARRPSYPRSGAVGKDLFAYREEHGCSGTFPKIPES